MNREKTTREMIYETNRDVKWICKTLGEMKKTDSRLEERVRDLEVWQSVKTGEEIRSHGVSAGVGAGAGGIVGKSLIGQCVVGDAHICNMH